MTRERMRYSSVKTGLPPRTVCWPIPLRSRCIGILINIFRISALALKVEALAEYYSITACNIKMVLVVAISPCMQARGQRHTYNERHIFSGDLT